MTKTFLEKRPLLAPATIAAFFLVGALGRWPYGYYQLLRWVVCAAAVFVAYTAFNWKKLWATYIFGFIALLFNPLFVIHLSRELWQPIDFICAVLFIIITFVLKKSEEEKRESD